MKQVVIAVAAALSLVFAVSAFGTDGSQPPQGTAVLNFDQMKANRMKILDERLNRLQEEKTCVQAANTQDDLKACRDKHKVAMKEKRDNRRGGRGMHIPKSEETLPVK